MYILFIAIIFTFIRINKDPLVRTHKTKLFAGYAFDIFGVLQIVNLLLKIVRLLLNLLNLTVKRVNLFVLCVYCKLL